MKQKAIHVKPIKKNQARFVIIGIAPLVQHRQPIIEGGKKIDDLEQEEIFKECWYPIKVSNGKEPFGFPAMALKSAMVEACTYTSNTKKGIKPTVFVEEDVDGLVHLFSPNGEPLKPEIKVVPIKKPSGATIMAVYAEFPVWGADVRISYWPSVITAEGITRLLQYAGEGVGIGSFRPENGREYGKFRIAEVGAIEQFDIL